MKVLLLLVAVLGIASSNSHAQSTIPVKSGEKIGFMGDSITAQGNSASGYLGLVIYGLKTEGVEATAIPAGVPGHTSGNMAGRVKPQIIDAKANWMTLSCGVNDVLMKKKGHGVELDAYKQNVTKMVESCLANNIRVMLLTPTPVGEDLDSESNRELAGYVEFLNTYAKEKGLPVAEINAAFRDYLKTPLAPEEKEGMRLLADGVHPNQSGQTLMAKTVLLAFGVPPEDMPKIEKAWLENPQGKSVKIGQGSFALISVLQYDALQKRGKGNQARSVVGDLWEKALKESGETDPAKAAEVAQSKIGTLVDEYLKQ